MEKACRYWEGGGVMKQKEEKEAQITVQGNKGVIKKKKEQEIEWAKQIEINGLVI